MTGADDGWRSWVDGLRGHVPDPYRPLHRPPASGEFNVRVARQRRQRALILSETRQLVGESGIDNVHLQTIADRAGVSVQTLYNLVGTRRDILGDAATEWVFALTRSGVELARRQDTNLIFTTLEVFWVGAIIHQQYNANMVRSRAHHAFMRQPFMKAGTLAMLSQLRELRAAGSVVRWADPPMIAEALAAACHLHISDWVVEPYDVGRFRTLLVNSCGLLLRGVLQGDEVMRLERRLDIATAAPL